MSIPRQAIVSLVCLVVSGCANHPLTDEVSAFTTYDIIQKVRCEARAELAVYFDERNFGQQVKGLKSINAEIKTAKSNLSKENIELGKKIQEEERLNQEKLRHANRLQRVERKLFASLINVKALGELISESLTDKEIKKIPDREKRLKSLLEKIKKYEWARERLLAEREFLIISATDLKKSITKLNGKAAARRITLNQLVNFRNLKFKDLIAFNSSVVAMLFNFDITETNDGQADGSITWPIGLGTIKLEIKGGDKKTRFSSRAVKIGTDFVELMALSCDDAKLSDGAYRAKRYPITGNIGIAEFIGQYLEITENTKISSTAESFRDKLQFTTVVSGGLKPIVTLMTPAKIAISGNLNLDVERKDSHEVIIEITKEKGVQAGNSTPSEVSIKNVPEFSIRIVESEEGPLD